MAPSPDLTPVLELLEKQRAEGLHDCAQVYISRHGETLLDAAIGESRPGRPLETTDTMLWYSSSKPVTTVALMQLWEKGRLGLDDPVAAYIEGWGAGKERCTIRHVLTHTGGFPMYASRFRETPGLTYADKLARIAAHPAEYEPGTRAQYHLLSGWLVLGGIVQVVDGRPIDRYVREEIFEPAGMSCCRLGLPRDEYERLGDRLVPMVWKGHALPVTREGGRVEMVPFKVDERGHNEPWYREQVEPGGLVQGPARELGRFYECLLGYGPRLLDPRTVEVMIACHRYGMRDAMFGNLKVPWGLGVQVSGAMSGGPGRRAFGHGGMASSRGMADPDAGLVMVVITNGLPGPLEHETRMFDLTDAVYRAFGDELAHLRRTARRPSAALYGT